MSRRKKNSKKRRKRTLRAQRKSLNKMSDSKEVSFKDKMLAVISGGGITPPKSETHADRMRAKFNGSSPGTGGVNTIPYNEDDEWGGYHGYGMGGYSSPKGMTGNNMNRSYSSTSNDAGVVVTTDKEGKPAGRFTVTWSYRDWWKCATHFYGEKDGECFIPLDRCKFSYGTVSFNACVYQASEDYIQARWGRKLHYTDKNWLAEHPYATDGGIPTEFTPICVQALVEPYGMGVSRVRLKKGSLAAGAEMQKFMIALGCNPFAMVDHQTTNKEAAEKMGISEEEANKFFRFEFHDEALPGSIVGEGGWTSTNGVQTGSGGGHARYLAPRDRANNWLVSLQLAPLEQIEYMAPIVLPEYVPRKGAPTLLMSDVLQPDKDEPVGVKHKADYYLKEEYEALRAKEKQEEEERKNRQTVKVQATPAREPEAQSGGTRTVADVLRSTFRRNSPDCGGSVTNGLITTRPAGVFEPTGTGVVKRGRFNVYHKCTMCNKQRPWSQFAPGTEVCDYCYEACWKEKTCPSCHTRLTGVMVPDFLKKEIVQGEVVTLYKCVKSHCGQEMAFVAGRDDQDFPQLSELSRLMYLGTSEEKTREIDEFLYHSNYDNFDQWWLWKHKDELKVKPSDQANGSQQLSLIANAGSGPPDDVVLIH